jgi:hypothetical protein
MSKPESIMIDNVKYVRSDVVPLAEKVDGLQYMIVRSATMGTYAGYVQSREGQNVTLIRPRLLAEWYGAAGLGQLALDGPKHPEKCKFSIEFINVEITNAVGFFAVSEKAKKIIQGVKIWQA